MLFMKKIRCRLDFHDYSNRDLIQFCTQVSNGIYNGSTTFATPTVTHVLFGAAFTKYANAVARYENAPKIEKTAMETARREMLDVLELLRIYVDQLANGDESLINLSGFVPTKSMVSKSAPLVVQESFDVRRTTNLGEVEVVIHKQSGYDVLWYFAICSSISDLPPSVVKNGVFKVPSGSETMLICFANGRTKVFSNLTTGKMYYFYVVAANSISVSPLSSPVGIQM